MSLKAGGFGREVLLRTDSSGREEAELAEGRYERVDARRVQADTQQIDHLQNRDFATCMQEASKQPFGQQLPNDVSHLSHLHHDVIILRCHRVSAEGVLKPEPAVLFDIENILDAIAGMAALIGNGIDLLARKV